MGYEIGVAVLTYLNHDVMEPWFDIDELYNRFSGFGPRKTVADARKVTVETRTVLEKIAEENLLDPPLAVRIRSKRMQDQPQHTKRRHGEEKAVWRERIDKEELIDTEFKMWLEKRNVQRKEAEEKRKTDPKYCYETEKEAII